MTVGNRLSDMEFDEISLVTRPANQLSKVVLFKSDTTEEDMTTEVENETTEDEMSKGYGKMKGRKMAPKMDIKDEMSSEDAAEDDEEMMTKKGRKMKKDDEMSESTIDLPDEVYEYVQALEAANAELMEQIEKMSASEENHESEDIMKSADPRIVEIVKNAQERAEAAEMIAKAERNVRLEREFVSKCATLNHLPIDSEEFGKVLKSVADSVDADTFAKVWQVLEAANANISTGDSFKEIGKSTGTLNDGPVSNIEKAASRLMESNPGMTKEQAIAKAVESDPTLYTTYLREGK